MGGSENRAIDLKFSSHLGVERRQSEGDYSGEERRCSNPEGEIDDIDLSAYREQLLLESDRVQVLLVEARKRKFFIINMSILAIPNLIAIYAAVLSLSDKSGSSDFMMPAIILIAAISSVFIAMSGMVSVKYIAAFKAQTNLLSRQANCLRQALDSLIYRSVNKEFPSHLDDLFRKNGVYYRLFGRHRKLPIGNEGFRGRYIASFTESADKSIIGVLFFASVVFLLFPTIYLATLGVMTYYEAYPYIIRIGIWVTIASIGYASYRFYKRHGRSFNLLRTDDGVNSKENDYDEYRESINTLKKYNYRLFTWKTGDTDASIILTSVFILWMVVGLSTELAIAPDVMLLVSLFGVAVVPMMIRKVLFDSLNRIFKSLITKSHFIER